MKEVVFKIKSDGSDPLDTENFLNDIVQTSIEHKKQNRALAFAFLIYDFESPHVAKILEDKNYWNSLHRIAGTYLSIYYIHSEADSLNEKKVYFQSENVGKPFNYLYGYKKEGGPSDIAIPVLRQFFNIEERIKLPALIFFQIEGQNISDAIFIELEEQKIEASFLELKETLIEIVNRLKDIEKENYQNSEEIFRELRTGVEQLQHKKTFRKFKRKIPFSELLSLIFSS
ncbi:MAG: hypothetical protein WD607_00340 [Candidatus Paceibacterota bacterium]